MSDTMSLGSNSTTRCWERKPRAVTIRSSCVTHTAPLSATPNCARMTPTSTSARACGSCTSSARRVPAISGTAEHTTCADGCRATNLAAAAAGLPTGCAAAPAFVRCSSKVRLRCSLKGSLRGRPGPGKAGIRGRLTRCGGRFWRIAASMDSRLSVLVSIVPPMREVPLAKSLLCQLGHVSFAPPRIECLVVEQKVGRVVQRRRGSFLQRVVFPGMAEHVPCDGKRQTFGQRQGAFARHHSPPFENLLADVDLHGTHRRAGSTQGRVERQLTVLVLVEGRIENDTDGTRIRRSVRQAAASPVYGTGVHAGAAADAFERVPEIRHAEPPAATVVHQHDVQLAALARPREVGGVLGERRT